MKAFFVVLAVFFVFVNGDSSSSKEFDENLKVLDSLLADKLNISTVANNLSEKVKLKCSDLETKLKETASQVESCVENVELGSETFCSLIKTNFAKCSQPVIEIGVSCLSKQSKDLPVMSRNIVLALIDQACNSTVEEILELFNPCGWEKGFDEIDSCEEVATYLDKDINDLLSMELVCDMLTKGKKCIKDHQEVSCKNPITKRSHSNFIEAIEEVVKNECDSFNNV